MHPIIKEDLEYITGAPLEWNYFDNKRILITGASGFIPAYMLETLLFLNNTKKLACKVTALVRNRAKAGVRLAEYARRHDLELIEGDVSQQRVWSCRHDVIIHAASQASPKFYDVDPVGTMKANILGTNHLLEMAVQWKTDRFLFFSTGDVYGQLPKKIPTGEADYGYLEILNHRSCYGESKRAGETLGASYAHQHGIHFVAVRPTHTYGPGMSLDDGRVFADFMRDAVNRRDIIVRGDGTAIRSFCYLADATSAFFTVLLKGASGAAYNVGNPDGALSMRDLAGVIAQLPTPPLNIVMNQKPAPGYLPSPLQVSIPNIDKLKALGWQPRRTPKEGFARTFAFFTGGR